MRVGSRRSLRWAVSQVGAQNAARRGGLSQLTLAARPRPRAVPGRDHPHLSVLAARPVSRTRAQVLARHAGTASPEELKLPLGHIRAADATKSRLRRTERWPSMHASMQPPDGPRQDASSCSGYPVSGSRLRAVRAARWMRDGPGNVPPRTPSSHLPDGTWPSRSSRVYPRAIASSCTQAAGWSMA